MPAPVPGRTTDHRLLAALLLLNAVLKFSWLGVNELTGDEPFTVHWAARPLAELFAMLRTENNPPLYFLLMKVWMGLVPLDEAWLRVPAALCGTLAVWPLYRLAQRLADRRTAVVACMLFTFSQYHYELAHEVRAYALFTLLATTGMWLLVRAVHRRSPARALPVLVVLNTVMVYTHFFGWLAIGVQGLCVFLLPMFRPLRKGYLFGILLTLLGFGPYLAIFLGRFGASVEGGTWVTVPGIEEVYNMVWKWSNAPVCAVLFLVLIGTVLVRDRLRHPVVAIATIWSLVPLVGMWLVSQRVPMYVDRYLAYAAPGFALLVAAASGSMVRLKPWPAWVGALCVAAMAFTFAPWHSNGRRPSEAASQLRAWGAAHGEVPVVVRPPWYRLELLWALDRQALIRSTWRDRWGFMLDEVAPAPDAPGTRTLVLVKGPGAEHVQGGAVPDPDALGYKLMEEHRPSKGVVLRRYDRPGQRFVP